MREFKIFDDFELQETTVVETKEFFVIPKENVAIRRNDFFANDELFYNRKFPPYSAVPIMVYNNYTNRGKYQNFHVQIKMEIDHE